MQRPTLSTSTEANSPPNCLQNGGIQIVTSTWPPGMLRPGGIICALTVSIGLIFASLVSFKYEKHPARDRFSGQAAQLVEMLGNRPRKVKFEPMAIDLPCSREELDNYLSWVSTPGPTEVALTSVSRQLHTGRLLDASGKTPGWVIRGKSPLVDHVKLGTENYHLTWRGLEAAAMASGKRSEHRDQTLSALAELGVELDSTIETKEGSLRVADLLVTSISEFHLDQNEISWTASALSSYLPPQTVWWNRYGEEFSFDTMVQEMMERKLNRESCRGLHLVMTLTKILRIDQDSVILTPQTRERLIAYVRLKLAEAVESQLEDGSWPPLWSQSGFSDIFEYAPADNNANRVLVTGHMLEWFQILPKDIKPPNDAVQAGSVWVLNSLRSASAEAVNKDFCPYTHAVLSLYVASFL